MVTIAGHGDGPDTLWLGEKEDLPTERSGCGGGPYLCPTETKARVTEDSQWLLVDVRRADEYARARIKGSISVPATEVESKVFLRSKKIVLVDTGYRVEGLEKLRDRLVVAGFSQVFLLDGGLNAWRQVVGPLEGDILVANRLNRITAQQFAPEMKRREWAVIDVTNWQESSASSDHESAMGHKDRTTGLADFLAAELGKKGPDARRILIWSTDGTGYEAVERAVAKFGWINVFYLDGGKQAYEAYLKMQQAIWSHKPATRAAAMQCGERGP